MTYRPNPDSLAGLVLGFLALNPHEGLTLDDIVAKFVQPGDSRNVHTQLMAALDHDMLTYDPDGDVYRKGPVDRPSVRDVDGGDDGTGGEAIALIARRKVATPAPIINVWPTVEASASCAINSAAHEVSTPRQVSTPFDVLKRTPPCSGESNGMDESGDRAGAPVAADSLGEGAGAATAREIGEGDQEVGRPARAAAQSADELAPHRCRADESGPADSQSDRYRPAEEGLETGRGDRVGGVERPDAAWHVPDGEEPGPTQNSGQPGALQLAGALGEGDGSESSSRVAPAHAAQGADQPSNQQAKEAGSAVDTVRDMLVQTLADLRDKSNPMDLARAKTIAEVSTAFVNLAKVQVDYVRVTQQQRGTIFETLPAPGGKP